MFILRFFYICLSAFLCWACSPQHTPPKSKKPLILVSIAPYRFLTEKIAGSNFEVETIVPKGSNPHVFEPTAKQVSKMSEARIWFRIGEPFEEKILPILKSRNAAFIAPDLRQDIDLIEDNSLSCKHCSMDHLDRHIWLSPTRAIKQAEIIEKTLSQKFPEFQADFEKNLTELTQELSALDAEIRDILKPVVNRTLLVSHPAFGYFCKDYNLNQLSVEYEGKDPRPQHLDDVLKKAITESANMALALPQYNNKGAQLIAKKLHMPVRFIDPYSSDYFEMMRELANLIKDPYAN